MDTPQVTPGLLELALRLLADGTVDAVLGPAADGGFWLLGLQRPRSGGGTRRAHVHRQDGGGATRQAGGRRLPVARLPCHVDVNALARQIPGSRSAAVLLVVYSA